MKTTDFDEKIKREVKSLSKPQAVHFAWVCAVRALPYLGGFGHFNFWKSDKRQKHLYAIFRSLDYGGVHNIYSDAYDDAYVSAASAAASASAVSASAAYAYAYAASAAYAAYAASDASYAYASYAYAASYASAASASAAAYAASSAAASSAAYAKNKLAETLFKDIETIRKGELLFDTSFEVYGDIWQKFQMALANEGCSYWGDLYQQIFDNGFKLDQDALKRRLEVPAEIGDRGAAAVAEYLREIETHGAERLNEARIIILGEKGAGKTCLARKLQEPDSPLTSYDESTEGVDTLVWKLPNDDIKAHIWDFAGHAITHAVHRFFLSERSLYIIVYDGRTEDHNRLEYWLDHMRNYGGDSKALIFVNIKDDHTPKINENSLREKYPIAGIHRFSLKDDSEKLERFREEVARLVKENLSWNASVIPANSFAVKEELECIFEEERQNCITRQVFNGIAAKNGIVDQKELLKNLHALGVCLWYEGIEKLDTLVLNPNWITNGVYKIVNWVHEQGKHQIALSDFNNVFSNDVANYPQDRHTFLFKLMKRYELAYETHTGRCLIIPHLLDTDQPARDRLPEFPIGDTLMLRYTADLPLPPDTVTRFIVHRNEEIKKEGDQYLVWRYGVVLQDGNGSIAKIQENSLERKIEVSVKGASKTPYIDSLRTTFNEIFESYKSKKPDLLYRIRRYGEIPDGEGLENEKPLMLSAETIAAHLKKQIPYLVPSTLNEMSIDLLRQLVSQYNIKIENLMIGSGGTIVSKSAFNFQNCNINLQGNLNDLARMLTNSGNGSEVKELVEELRDAAEALKDAQNCKTPEEVRSKGVMNRLKRMLMDLGDEDSTLRKVAGGVKYGIDTLQEIAKDYNSIAEWIGLPQVPTAFLKK